LVLFWLLLYFLQYSDLSSGEGNSTFSKATFVNRDGTEAIDLQDPNFWEKMLPEEAHAQLFKEEV
jgi:hypothetical protein